MFGFRRKKNRLGVSPETAKTVLSAEVPDGLDMELNTDKIPEINLKLETKTIEGGTTIKYEPPPYVEPTHKEIIEGLEECGDYEAAFLIRSLKKEVKVLKGKLTKLTKKYEALKEHDWHGTE